MPAPEPISTAHPARLSLDDLLAMRMRGDLLVGRGQGTVLNEGRHRSRRHGSGAELDSVGAWQEGDDPRHIDWHATARSGSPQVRRHFMQTQRTVLIVVDLRDHMIFGMHGGPLARTACLAAAAISGQLARAQTPFVILAVDSQPADAAHAARQVMRASRGFRGRVQCLARLAERYAHVLETAGKTTPQALPTLAQRIASLLADWRRRGDVMIISDFSRPGEDLADVIGLRPSGSVLGVSIEDDHVRDRIGPGWYPMFAGPGTPLENISLSALTPREADDRVMLWHDQLATRLHDAGISRLFRCDGRDLADGRLR